jgi:hypothetical protein
MRETPALADWPTDTDPKVTEPGETSMDPKLEVLEPLEFRLCVHPVSISTRENNARKTSDDDRQANVRIIRAHKLLSQQNSCENSGNETLVFLTWLSSASHSPMSCEYVNSETPHASSCFWAPGS